MKGTTNATQQTLFGEILNLRLVTNQSSHEDLIGATVKINSQIYTWDGQDITVEIPAMTTYTIEVSEVEGYRTPEIQIINSQIGNVNNVTLSYDCELVTINVSDSDGNILDSSNVTINGIVGNKIPYGETYTVVANAIGGYTAPESQTYTANQPQRTVNMVYQVNLMGVYIEDIDGNLYTEAQWDGSKTANGIAVLTDNCEFVMALQDAYTSTCQWGSYGTEVTDILTTIDASTAKTDYRGNENTTAILNQLGNSSSTSDAPPAYYCRAFTFPNGRKGYLGAAGEWQAALSNKNAIVSALSKCGGTAISNYYWTSTQSSPYDSWCIRWDYEALLNSLKDESSYVRAFTVLKSDGDDSLFPATISYSYLEENTNNADIAIYLLGKYPDMDTSGDTYTPISEQIEIVGSNFCDGVVVGVSKYDNVSVLLFTEESFANDYGLRVVGYGHLGLVAGHTDEHLTD